MEWMSDPQWWSAIAAVVSIVFAALSLWGARRSGQHEKQASEALGEIARQGRRPALVLHHVEGKTWAVENTLDEPVTVTGVANRQDWASVEWHKGLPVTIDPHQYAGFSATPHWGGDGTQIVLGTDHGQIALLMTRS
ncbi:hypothetical protein H639_01134 [Cutibacterium avidum TM16]|uniref:hypothetical protein n=1 Tax=Cutibacterium avidum TaxID=33010 RepID=UPI0003912165|nr:hypothetical protein [Cutibacterium avidum]ERF59130.1 hypothetical protein H639_01134 [Cutibacterium avidum TM16]